MIQELQAIHDELNDINFSMKAEVLVAKIEDKATIDHDAIMVSNKSAFNRSYRNDVLNVTLDFYEDGREVLNLGLARNGIYDLLPEGVFHSVDAKHISESYKVQRDLQKKEENEARLLFAPLEDALFRSRVEVEKKENQILRDFSNLEDEFLMNFWKIDTSLPKKLAVKLLRLLPYAHQISGDLELTFQCLRTILGVEVSYKKGYESIHFQQNHYSETRLGVDFVLQQDTLTLNQPTLQIIIQPQSKKQCAQFIEGQSLKQFLRVFYEYFIPFEYHIKTEVQAKEADAFILGSTFDAYLGIATRV